MLIKGGVLMSQLCHCSAELETLTIRCRPFYIPREFASSMLMAVFTPHQAGATAAAQQLSPLIMDIDKSNQWLHNSKAICPTVIEIFKTKRYHSESHAARMAKN